MISNFVTHYRLTLILGGVFFSLQLLAQSFPLMPDLKMTPGTLCQRPTEKRYPERISYCKRNVDKSTKDQVIANYEAAFGYKISPRQDFKVDHFVALCMGGSNEIDNLWPQHKSVYAQTDGLEQLMCEKMNQGKLLQKDAVTLLKQAKTNLKLVPTIVAKVLAL